jgi:hypothetical protein
VTRLKTRLRPVDFCFFLLKRRRFVLKKELIRATRAWTGPGLKTMVNMVREIIFNQNEIDFWFEICM